MKLSDEELRDLYVGLIKPFQHPDPVGFVVRALLLSEGDPDFVDGNNRGFLPLDTEYAVTQTGVPEIQSLSNNITAALALDRIAFGTYANIDDMTLSTHYENNFDSENYTAEQEDFLNAVEESRVETLNLLEPRLASVQDIIDLLSDNKSSLNITKEQQEFFDFLLTNKV